MTNVSILIVGVGGQGVLTTAMFLGAASDIAGFPVRIGQLHGMSQRGGCVESTVLVGSEKSPFLPPRGADIVIALEPMELLRAVSILHSGTRVLASSSKVVPTTAHARSLTYPDPTEIFEAVRARVQELVVFDGRTHAAESGCPRAVNTLAMGLLASQGWLPFSVDAIEHAIEQHSNRTHLSTHRLAFEAGRRLHPS